MPPILKWTAEKYRYDNDGKDTKDDVYMATVEMKKVMAQVTHVKLERLLKIRREVVAGRKRYPHGLIAHKTLGAALAVVEEHWKKQAAMARLPKAHEAKIDTEDRSR